jgi:hypothetical protein
VTKLFKEPLLQFILLGAVLFGVYSWVSSSRASKQENLDRKFTVSRLQIEALATQHQSRWNRPPTDEELKNLVDELIREEVLYREALTLKLDENDNVIRRLLRQKLELITENIASMAQPSDRDLQQFLEENPDPFREPPRFTFRQIFLNPDKRGDAIHTEAASLLADLNEAGPKANIDELGDRLMAIDTEYTDTPEWQISRAFGQGFTDQLAQLPLGEWTGPILSGYGMHLVLLENLVDDRLPALADIREKVAQEWTAAQAKQLKEDVYQELRNQYKITVEEASDPGP